MANQFTTSYNIEFDVLSAEIAPEIPEARGNKESPLRTALKDLPNGGFVFVKGSDIHTRKRVSDMCSRIRRMSNRTKNFSLRLFTLDGEDGVGIWRTDVVPVDPRLAKVKVKNTEIPWPTKDKLMAGK